MKWRDLQTSRPLFVFKKPFYNVKATFISFLILSWLTYEPGAVACTCNPATFKAEFRNSMGSIPVRVNSPLVGGQIVWPSVIQH